MLSASRCGTRDLKFATKFYDAIADMVGARRVLNRPEVVGYKGVDGAMLLIGIPYDGEATVGNGVQVAVNATSRAIVDAVHAKALDLGGKCEGPPGVRGDDPNGFYGAYFRDPDGNKLVVFRMGPADLA